MKKALLLIAIVICYLTTKSQVVINEVFATNASVNLDPYYNFSGWAELYNSGTTNISLGNHYFSDDRSNKFKWRIPITTIGSKQFAIFWFNEKNSSNSSNFKLNANGGILYINDANGVIIDSIAYPEQYPNISYARYPDGSSSWKYNSSPTLKTSNSSNSYSDFTSAPIFSQPGGFYKVAMSVAITTANPSAEIRYTINGAEPKQNSKLYTTPITVYKTTIIRARVFESGKLPSKMVTQSYIFPDRKFNLPVYSLTTDTANLWNNTIGIHVDGTNGISGYCSDVLRNSNQDWERPVNLELFDSSGVQLLNQYAGFEIGGNCSRQAAQKSFIIAPRNVYGKGKLKYKFFDDKNITEFDRIFLRNSGNDNGFAFLRDALCHTLVGGKIDVDYNAYKPSVVYLNGNYWGIMDTREKIDEHYVMSNYKLEDKQFDMLENDKSPINGSVVYYTSFMNYVAANSLATSSNYEYVKSLMDMNEYINYMITQIYIGNSDWPGNNLRYWRSNLSNGKWRWILMDLDFGFGVYDRNVSQNTLELALATNGPSWPNPPWSTLLFRKLVENTEFKKEFTRRFGDYLNTIFEPSRVIQTIDSLKNNISYEMYYHNLKWGAIDNWDSQVEYLRTYAKQRPDYMRIYLVNKFGLTGTYKLSISSNISGAGDLYVNQIQVPGDSFSGTYFKDYPVHIKPVAKELYKFLGWYKQVTNTESINLITKNSSWKYSDNGSLPAADWYTKSYDDSNWKSGNGQLGYGDGDESTVIAYGNDANNKYTSYYFRKSFNLSDIASYNGLKLYLLVDDGALVYLNGQEIIRRNLPAGTIENSTLANAGVNDANETTYFEYSLPVNLLNNGLNTISVEVHQVSLNSSDISFDVQLVATKKRILSEQLLTGEEIDINSAADIEIQAKYKYLGSNPSLYINEIVADNKNGASDETGSNSPWIEIYNSSDKVVNLAGWYISNNKNQPLLYQIPSGNEGLTTINPDGYIVFWADGNTSKGILHLPFVLASGSGQLFLTNISETGTVVVDSISYPAQISDVAYGRYKDGTEGLYYLSSPTPTFNNRQPNKLPEFTSSPVLSANELSPYTYNITAFDYEGDKMNFNYSTLPSWLLLTDNNNGTATLHGTPINGNRGTNPIVITVSDGKSFTPSQQAFTIKVDAPLSIDGQVADGWKIYPNPVKNRVNIVPANGSTAYHMKLTDSSGKLIIIKSNVSGANQIDLSSFSNGIYLLEINTGKDFFTYKFLKTK